MDEEGNYENKEASDEEQIYESPLQLLPSKEYILILCEQDEFDEAREHFGCGFVQQNNGGPRQVVKSRTVNYRDYVNRNTK